MKRANTVKTTEKDSLMRWRANIPSSILIAGLITGVFAFAAAALILEKNAQGRGLAFVDSPGVGLCLVFFLSLITSLVFMLKGQINGTQPVY